MIRFDNSTYDLGKVAGFKTSGGNEKPLTFGVEWNFVISSNNQNDEVEFIKPDCGCTAEIKWGALSKVTNTNLWSGKLKARFTPNEGDKGVIQKGITLYLKDGNPLMIMGSEGYEVYNPNKAQMRIFIKGNIT